MLRPAAAALPFALLGLVACGGASSGEAPRPDWSQPILTRIRLPGLPAFRVEEAAMNGRFGRFLKAARRVLVLPAPPAPPADGSQRAHKAWMAREMLPYLQAHVRAYAGVVRELAFLTEGSAREQVYGSAALGQIAERRARAEAFLPEEDSEAQVQRAKAREHYATCVRVATEEELERMAEFCRDRMRSVREATAAHPPTP